MQENLYPFSPLVCRDTISDGFHEFLMDGLDGSCDGYDYSKHLAGNIQNQKAGDYDPQLFYDFVNPYVQGYFQQEHRDSLFFHANDPTQESNEQKLDHVTYDLGPLGPWVNFMKPHEYNPIHRHNGDLSAIIFIDIPEEIDQERIHNRENGLQSCASGLVDFWCYNTNWLVSPKTKQILLFPPNLLHGVYPFSSNVQRITMSFNLHNLKKHYE